LKSSWAKVDTFLQKQKYKQKVWGHGLSDKSACFTLLKWWKVHVPSPEWKRKKVREFITLKS
jgi:hypothetical protein